MMTPFIDFIGNLTQIYKLLYMSSLYGNETKAPSQPSYYKQGELLKQKRGRLFNFKRVHVA